MAISPPEPPPYTCNTRSEDIAIESNREFNGMVAEKQANVVQRISIGTDDMNGF
jgi:hypothetical protein